MSGYNTENGENGSNRQFGWAAGFLFLAFVMYFMPSGPQQQIAAGVRLTFLQPFLFTQRTIADTRIRAREMEVLLAERDSLIGWMRNQAPVQEENERLRSLLSLSERVGREYVAASLVRPGVAGSESMFVLDRGQLDGVRPNSMVMTEGGLLGAVREARAETSVGMDWTHPDFRASVMTEDGEIYGIVGPERGAFREADRLVLSGAPFHADVPEGTLLLTSGRGGVYPRGVPVGTVESVAETEAGWRRSYWVRPLVRPGSVTHALVDAGDAAREGMDDMRAVWFPDAADARVVAPPPLEVPTPGPGAGEGGAETDAPPRPGGGR